MLRSKHLIDAAAHVIYAEQLASRGKGYPMWDPDPQKDLPIEIGDVGFLGENGTFIRLFNIIEPSDARNTYGTPEDFEPLRLDHRLTLTRENAMDPGSICSKNVTETRAEADLGGGIDLANASFTYQFDCQSNSGAVLVLPDHARVKEMINSRNVINYMRQNYDKWFAVTQQPELAMEIHKESILLVRGWVKTTQWRVMAWAAKSRTESVALQVQGAHFAQLGLRASYGQGQSGSPEAKAGPVGVRAGDLKMNQTVFFSYYKIKYRLKLYKTIEAHAGDDELPDPEDDQPPPSSSSEVEIETDVELRSYNDPVDALLNYILNHEQTAEVAIASDGDLQELFGDEEWPDNIYDFLVQQEPKIDVDEDGTATLSLEQAILRKHRRAEQLVEQAVEQQEAAELAAAEAAANVAAVEEAEIQAAMATADEQADQQPEAGPSNQGGIVQEDQDIGGDAPPGNEDDADEDDDDDDDEMDNQPARYLAPSKVVPETLRGATLIHGRDKGVPREIDWPHYLLYDGSAEGGAVCSMSVSNDFSQVAAGFEDHVIRVWDLHNFVLLHRLAGHTDTIWGIAYCPADHRKVVSGSGDKTVVIWDTLNGGVALRLRGHEGDVWSVAYSPDGKQVASGATDGSVRIWNAMNGDVQYDLEGHPSVVMYLAFSADGTRLISGADSVGRVWNPGSGELCGTIQGHDGIVWTMAISPDGSRLITGGEDKAARIWSSESGEELVRLFEHTGAVWAVAWSPDGRKVATGSFDKTVVVCDSIMGQRQFVLRERPSVINALAWSQAYGEGDEGLIASGSAEGYIKLWRGDSGEFIAEVQGHKDKIKKLAFTAGGMGLVSSSDDGTIRIWNVQDILRL